MPIHKPIGGSLEVEFDEESPLLVPAPETERLEMAVQEILEQVGEDPQREGLLKTPNRVAQTFRYLTQGYSKSVAEVVNGAVYHEKSRDMVLVKDISFYSMCEHHLLPFFGKAHVAYLPNDRVIGLSKIPRLVHLYARRLQMQERLTRQVAEALEEVLAPDGVAVVMEGYHLCMMMRGVEEQHCTTVTASLRGRFETDLNLREKFFRLLPVRGPDR
jgi:GTP cyclohydrolase I